jgi:hypothetical protein
MDVDPAFHFVLDPRSTHWPDLDRLDESDIDALPDRFVGGRNSWIAQTFVRLRPALEARGWRVTTGANFVPDAINIAHRDDANCFSADAAASFLVVVRADRARVRACDVAIAQNALGLARNERFVPLWPQPGLRGRHPGRGVRLERLAYEGRIERVPDWFTDTDFLRALRRRGVRFEIRARGWGDYTAVDAVLATRDESSRVLSTKPATKLYNGWIAGVPVLAAPEPAYADLRRDPLDFFEVSGPLDVLHAIDALHADPGLYRSMVRNGRERGVAFEVEATRQRWLDLIEHEVVPSFLRVRDRLPGRAGWFLGALAWQKAENRWHKLVVAAQRGHTPLAGTRPRGVSVGMSSSHLSVAKGFLPVK